MNVCRERSSSCRFAALALTLIAIGAPRADAQAPALQPSQPDPRPAPTRFDEDVAVVGVTPIQGLGIDRDKIPSNIQSATAGTLERSGAVSVGEQINLTMPTVHVNEATTHPFQPDLQFRGFVGSPLLGLPQGLAVYQNGVRVNEPFGDTVNWDMLPTNAIASIDVMAGSNPLFGLNALGGAVSLHTKTGFSHPGHDVSISAGRSDATWCLPRAAATRQMSIVFPNGNTEARFQQNRASLPARASVHRSLTACPSIRLMLKPRRHSATRPRVTGRRPPKTRTAD